MTEDRIKELQDFADDFKQRLITAKEKYEQTHSNSIELENSKKDYKPSDYSKKTKSQRILKHIKNLNVKNFI